MDIPAYIEKIITTPHSHESENMPPLWILWRHEIDRGGISDGPKIDSICNSESMARYNYTAMLESFPQSSFQQRGGEVRFYVERVPANHRFASSMADVFYEHILAQVDAVPKFQAQFKYNRDGD